MATGAEAVRAAGDGAVTARSGWLAPGLLAVVYFASAIAGDLLSAHHQTYVSFWLPAGVYVAALLLVERRLWPRMMLGALIANFAFDLPRGTPALATALFFVANTAQAFAGAWLMENLVQRRSRLATLRELAGLIGLVALASTVIGAAIGAGTLVLHGFSPSFVQSFVVWWGSCAMAIALVAPFLLTWVTPRPRFAAALGLQPSEADVEQVQRPRRRLEAAVLAAGMLAVCWHVLLHDGGLLGPNKARLLPFLLWAGLRFGPRGATAANLLLALAMSYLTTHYAYPVSAAQVASGSYVLTLQTFVAIASIVSLVPAIVLSERDRTVARLTESEERFRQLNAAAFEGIVISEKGVVVDVNEQLLKMFGYERAEDMVGRRIIEFVAEESRAAVLDAVRLGHEAAYEHSVIRKDGSVFYAEAQAKTVHRDGKAVRMTALRDVTERRLAERERQQAEDTRAKLEAQLRQSQKLEAIGTLAGGIAHDFNNILGAIISFTELTRLENPDNASVQRNLAEVVSASNRAAALVQQVLTFSRKQPQKRSSLDLAPVVREALRMLRSTLPSTIEIDARLPSELPPVMADPTQIHQIMVNLCTNAGHAIKGQGTISVELDAREHGGALEQAPELPAGSYVVLTVRDTGQGMSEDTLQRMFEPFYTTKGPGEGSGLGLAVVHGIVKDHGGTIAAESRLGQGTCMRVFLPCTSQPAAVSDEARLTPRGSGERILFVDDEPVLCAAGSALLARFGFQPKTFTNPDEAWSAFSERPDEYDLVITDLTMPRMTGVELARRMLQVRPGLPIILTSGSPIALGADSLRELGVRDLLIKPVDYGALLSSIRRGLEPAAHEREVLTVLSSPTRSRLR